MLKARKRGRLTHGEDPAAIEQWYQSLQGETGSHIIDG